MDLGTQCLTILLENSCIWHMNVLDDKLSMDETVAIFGDNWSFFTCECIKWNFWIILLTELCGMNQAK